MFFIIFLLTFPFNPKTRLPLESKHASRIIDDYHPNILVACSLVHIRDLRPIFRDLIPVIFRCYCRRYCKYNLDTDFKIGKNGVIRVITYETYLICSKKLVLKLWFKFFLSDTNLWHIFQPIMDVKNIYHTNFIENWVLKI